MKIAIVEDDHAIAQMYEIKLKHLGYRVAIAKDGEKGFELAKSFAPDLILLDLMLPGITGEEMLKKLRATDWGKPIRVIVLTNVSQDEAPKELRNLHVDRYMLKAQHTPSQVAKAIADVFQAHK